MTANLTLTLPDGQIYTADFDWRDNTAPADPEPSAPACPEWCHGDHHNDGWPKNGRLCKSADMIVGLGWTVRAVRYVSPDNTAESAWEWGIDILQENEGTLPPYLAADFASAITAARLLLPERTWRS